MNNLRKLPYLLRLLILKETSPILPSVFHPMRGHAKILECPPFQSVQSLLFPFHVEFLNFCRKNSYHENKFTVTITIKGSSLLNSFFFFIGDSKFHVAPLAWKILLANRCAVVRNIWVPFSSSICLISVGSKQS